MINFSENINGGRNIIFLTSSLGKERFERFEPRDGWLAHLGSDEDWSVYRLQSGCRLQTADCSLHRVVHTHKYLPLWEQKMGNCRLQSSPRIVRTSYFAPCPCLGGPQAGALLWIVLYLLSHYYSTGKQISFLQLIGGHMYIHILHPGGEQILLYLHNNSYVFGRGGKGMDGVVNKAALFKKGFVLGAELQELPGRCR